ncbi:transposase [Marivirga tractuosa]|uniref:transposase n=1 Tax=Marivirga tractuosa TaxID=1006 RepID=UPI0035D0A582
MLILNNCFYHVYNQGNNQEKVFYNRENKLYFLRKFRSLVAPYCDVLAYTLMDNHFHFLIYSNSNSIIERDTGNIKISSLQNGFRNLISSYTQAINKQENNSGSIFRKRTKFKLLDGKDVDYPFICFNYIHQNPMVAGLVSKMEDWEFSSFLDYAGFRNGSLCNQNLAKELIGISENDFYKESYKVISEDKILKLLT